MQMKLYGFTKFRNPYANTLLHKVAMENTNDHVPRSTAPAPAGPAASPLPSEFRKLGAETFGGASF